jgi:hypothetical protein
MYAIFLRTHQKIDRAAYKNLKGLLRPDDFFPSLKTILNFEGGEGPDGPNLKQTKGEQPWHFVDPFNAEDTQFHDQIRHHFNALSNELAKGDGVRAGFESAWLAHALVDGLTPAHHYPYEKELAILRGEHRDTRTGLLDRLYVQGETITASIQKSLKLVGPKGLLTTHTMFEAGSHFIMTPIGLRRARPSPQEVDEFLNEGAVAFFKKTAREIAELNLYGRFYTRGWTQKLARDLRREMAPRMVKIITLAWYAASLQAGK